MEIAASANRRLLRSGSALVVVLWVIGLMSILVTSMAFEAHLEARVTSYYRKRMKAEYLAMSGLEVAEMLMRRSVDYKKTPPPQVADTEDDYWYEDVRRLSEGLEIAGLQEKLGDGTITLDIKPEPALRNVNRLNEEDWERVLEVGGIPEEYWAELVECFQDWLDPDDKPRINGAETEDYYDTLDAPYGAKNGNLDTVDELLEVKGFTPAILFGGQMEAKRTTETGEEKPEPITVSGIYDLLTTYGDGKVNVNAAGDRVLRTLLDVDAIDAGAIIEEREGTEDDAGKQIDTSFKSVEDFMSRVPGLNPAVKNSVSTSSAIFRIQTKGRVGNVERQITCVATFAYPRLTIVRWREE